jgi:hypothetical protein
MHLVCRCRAVKEYPLEKHRRELAGTQDSMTDFVTDVESTTREK